MESFPNIFGHPHELIVCRGWRSALCHKVANGLCDVTETEQERYWGTPDEVFQRERLQSGKMHHDVGE